MKTKAPVWIAYSLIAPWLLVIAAWQSKCFRYRHWMLTLYGGTITIAFDPLGEGPDGVRHQLYVHTYYVGMGFEQFLAHLWRILTFQRAEIPGTDVYTQLWDTQLPENMKMQECGAPMEAFFSSVGLVLAGNTQTQFNALCHGLPVIQLPGLDPLVFDHHGYVRGGIVFGLREISGLDLDAVVRFYSDNRFSAEMRKLLGPGPEDRSPPLSALLEAI